MYSNKRMEELGIEIISKLDDRTVCDLASKIAILLVDTFSNCNLDYLKVVSSLQNIQVYIAKIPKGIAPVDYFFKDNVMYISDEIEISSENEFILHEAIHRVEESKNKKKQLVQLGICDISETKIQGMALNEAAVQYIVSKLLKKPLQVVEVYDMKIPTISKNYYPIITNLMQQLAFVLDEDVLISSVLNSNDEFNYNAIDALGEKNFFTIQSNFDKILENKDSILERKIVDTDVTQNVEQIRNLYIETQKIILTSYFDNMISRLETTEEVNMYKSKLIQYNDLIGASEGVEFYINYYKNKMEQIKAIEQNIESRRKRELIVVSNNKLLKIINKIKNYLQNSFSRT